MISIHAGFSPCILHLLVQLFQINYETIKNEINLAKLIFSLNYAFGYNMSIPHVHYKQK